MKKLTIDRRKRVKAGGVGEKSTPPGPPTAQRTRRVVVSIGRKRYELTTHTEIREITQGPAKLIQMPLRPTIE